MRDDIREPGEWKSGRRTINAANSSWSLKRRHAQSSVNLEHTLPIAAVDAAFEEVDLEPSEAKPPHRIDSGAPKMASSDELFKELTLQLAALESQCHHLQRLIISAKS